MIYRYNPAHLDAVSLVAEMERYERRSRDMRFSSKLRAEATLKADALRRRIERMTER